MALEEPCTEADDGYRRACFVKMFWIWIFFHLKNKEISFIFSNVCQEYSYKIKHLTRVSWSER